MKSLVPLPSLQLADIDSQSLRTIADAVEILRNLEGFHDNMRVEVRVGQLQLPSGQKTGLARLIWEEQGWVVPLPPADHFSGIRPTGERREQFEISRLHGAIVDSECNVQLPCGTYLRAVSFRRTIIPDISTELQNRILELTIQFIGAETRCYRYGFDLPEGSLRFSKPALDYSTFPGLELPKLESIVAHIRAADRTLRRLSRQTVANTLAIAGARPIFDRRARRART